MPIRARRLPLQASALALSLAGLAACNSAIEVGQATLGGTSVGATSGGRETSAGTTRGGTNGGEASSGGTTSGRTSSGETTGNATTGGTIGKPEITVQGGSAQGAATFPDPCEVDFDFGNLAIGLTTNETFTITNIGNGALDLLTLDPFLDPAFGLSYTPPPPIEPSGKFQFSISFSPSRQGQVTSVLSVPTDGLNPSCPGPPGTRDSPLTVQLIGTGIVPCLKVQPSTLDLGITEINTTAKKSVTLTNTCSGPANGIAAALNGVDANLFEVLNSPSSVAGGASAIVNISYSPLALETRSLASVKFSDSDGQSVTVDLFGEPVAVALTVLPNPINCGSVSLNSTAICCTTVTDQANVDVDITGVVNFADEAGAFAVSQTDSATPANPAPIPVIVKAGGSAEVCFSFTPTDAQDYAGQATLQTNDPSGSNPIIQLMGKGTN